jgi:hypothetical protein
MVSVAFAVPFRLLSSWGGKLCVDSRISSYRNIMETKNIKHEIESEQFLPFGNSNQKICIQVLPNVYSTKTSPTSL